MATRKRPRVKHPPKVVEFFFDEKMPRQPAVRPSRLLRRATAAANRLAVEELLCRHHGASDAAVRRLSPGARKVLFRIVTDPADRDHVYRRDAVSALAAIGSRDAVMLLSMLATDDKEDAVIVGRALNGLAMLGGDAAARIIERSIEHRDAYVRTAALKAMMRLEHPASVPALTRAAAAHPSLILQARARKRLAELGVAVKGSRSVVTRNKGVLARESER
jgi:HEAT repeat protein